jgi:hypothetical protein
MYPGLDGVQFDPRAANLNDPAWVEAYEAASLTFRAILPWVWLEWPAMAGAKLVQREDFDMYIAYADEVLNNTEYKYTDEEYETARRVKEDLLAYRAKRSKGKRSRKPGVNTAGFVYVLKSPLGAFKIGRTKSPDKRLKRIEVKMPFEVELVTLVQTDDMYELEISLHERFAGKHVNGEWFALEPEDIEYIKSLQGE